MRDQITALLQHEPGLTAKEIATRLSADRKSINSLLYGRLRQQVRQDNSYRWYLRDGNKATPSTAGSLSDSADTEKRSHTPLGKLVRYYLSCLSHDDLGGISVFQRNKYGSDYVELEKHPFVDAEFDVFQSDEARRLQQIQANNRSKKVLYVGYPNYLRLHKAKSGWEGYFVEPIFLFPFEETENRFQRPSLAEDVPHFNFRVFESLSRIPKNQILDEALQLSEELGIDYNDQLPDFDEMVARLQALRPEWKWNEDADPTVLNRIPPLSTIEKEGIYNRAILILGERSPFTRGLEQELGKLGVMDEAEYTDSALGKWINEAVFDETINPDDSLLLEVLPLNSEQRQAVQQALANQLTVITGPPGTGKSQVVTSILINAAWRNQKVLFASKNNKAVDVVEMRVNNIGPRPILIRTGRNEHQQYLADYLVKLKAASTTEEDKLHYEEWSARHQEVYARFEEIKKSVEQHLELRNQVDRLDREIDPIRTEIGEEVSRGFMGWDVGSARNELNSFTVVARSAIRENNSAIVRLFWPLIRDKRVEKLIQTSREVEAVFSRLLMELPSQSPSEESAREWFRVGEKALGILSKGKLLPKFYDALEELNKATPLETLSCQHMELIEELADVSEQLYNSWLRLQPARLTAEERKLLSDYASLLKLIVRANEEGTRIGKEVFAKQYRILPEVANVLSCWAVTSLSARGKIPYENAFFDLLIVDEASQCDIASVLPLLYRAKRVAILGDPNQLRHISSLPEAQDKALLAKHEVLEDYLSWAYSTQSLFDLATGLCRNEDVVYLRDHHRSHSHIVEFSNEQFYEGRLRVATKYERLNTPRGDEDVAVQWMDVRGKAQHPAQGSWVNENEAKAVVEVLSDLVVRRKYLGTIGVVSPFRAQANRISELVNRNEDLEQALMQCEFLADTVHRFQGDERDVIVFSPVVAKGISQGGLGFLRRTGNLFNVAITRARAALYVVGDERECHNSGIDYLSGFVEYVQNLKKLDSKDLYSESDGSDIGPDYPSVSHPERVSDWERLFYRALYEAGIRAIPQYHVDKYDLDLALFNEHRKLDIEVDGERYHRDWDGELTRRDQLRNRRLMELGWDVMRFWVYQLRDDLSGCVAKVIAWSEDS